MMTKIMEGWLGASIRGCFFTFKSNHQWEIADANEKWLIEQAREEALRLKMENASEEERNQLRLLNQAGARWKNSKMAGAWLGWRDKYEQYLDFLRIIRKSFGRWSKQKISQAYQKWFGDTDFESGKPLKVRDGHPPSLACLRAITPSSDESKPCSHAWSQPCSYSLSACVRR